MCRDFAIVTSNVLYNAEIQVDRNAIQAPFYPLLDEPSESSAGRPESYQRPKSPFILKEYTHEEGT